MPLGRKASREEPSLFQCSSGTSGTPKLIRRLWKDVDVEIDSYNKAIAWADSDIPLILVPVYHSFGLVGMLAALARRVKPIIVVDKNPKHIAKMVRSTRNAVVYGVPFLFHLAASFQKEPLHFYKIISSGSPLTDDLLQTIKKNSQQVYQQYGCSEIGCISIADDPASASDVGKPLPHLEVAVAERESDFHEVVVSFGNNTICTGDIGFLSPDGSLQIYGRLDDLICVSGLKVAPLEVERVITSMPGIAEAVVHRTKHPVWGEAVKAIIVRSGLMSAEEVRDWCKWHLPPYKVPGVVEFVKEIPRPPSGKISRKYLSERGNV
ncbi:AMP-binding protein [Cohnella faecalis]|uniref:AMP-binding protein n=1 Tax=Cohnella faecalis TaxID=2315694 RepID=UPI001F3553CD|nr:AMP-binding protein [Cohnella faecalis]